VELYTLTSRFLPKEIITDFTSVIWTERYAAAGDVQIVVPPTPSMIKRFAKGTFIGLRGTSEIMMIETQSIENGLLTVTGSSIVKFLNNRTAWFADTTYDGSDTTKPLIQSTYGGTDTAGSFISNIISAMVINPVAFTSYWTSINLDWGNEIIHGLALGRVDTNGDSKALTFNKGPLYDGLAQFAEAEGLGFKLYLESANYSSGFVLRFATYRGRDKTSGQTINRMVRLTPKMDTLTNVKEINSIEKYINVVYVSYKNQISVHYPPDILSPPLDFNRRVLQVDAEDIFLEDDHILAYRNTVARNAFIDHVYIQAVDGQILPPISDYKFKRDYDLGDVIELEGYTGTISKARVTEYIRSQDQFGIKEFPTLAVIDPQHTGYMPDLEPSLDDGGGWPWDNDPSWDFPIDDSIDDDLEHDPDARKDPNDKPDPNPDPTPVFPTDGDGGNGGGDGGGDGGSSNPEPSSTYMVLGYFPDQNNGEAIGYLKFSGELLHAWTYAPEDTSPDASGYWVELDALGWTFDHQYVITRSEEDKSSTDAYPWDRGFAFWLMSLDGTAPKRLTETLGDQERTTTDDPLGVTHRWNQSGIIWCEATDNWRWYVISDHYIPGEAVYADGTYWRVDLLPPDMSIHGEQQGIGSPQELFLASGTSTPSSTDDLTKILGMEDFPVHMRWSSWGNLLSSPDGSKLCMSRRQLGPVSEWKVSSQFAATGGTFKLTMGEFGNLSATYTTAPIPFNTTAADLYMAIDLACPLVQDPRSRGYPDVPYSGGPLPTGQINMRFDALTPMGVWIVIHDDDLIVSFGEGYEVTHSSPPGFREIGDDRWFLCNQDGTSLEEIDFGTPLTALVGWSPDSTKLHALAPSAAGDPYCRLLTYDVATGDVSFPLDYSDVLDSGGSGPLTNPKFSPDSSKIVWMLSNPDLTKTLWVSYADGTGAVEIYHDTVTSGHSTDLGIILLGGTDYISWSFDSKKIAIVDARDEAPVWIFDTVSGSLTRIWDGSGWDNPDNQKWLNDPMTFDG
jgi:hypothetical protein